MGKIQDFLNGHPVVRVLLMMLVISLAILIVVFTVLKYYGRVGREYEMPDFTGKSIAEADAMQNMKVKFVVIDSVYVEGDEGGHILTQDPQAGSMVKKGRKIFVSISSYAPEDASVPDLTDMTVRQAVSQLSGMGFSVGRLKFVESQFRNVVLEATHKGRVIAAGSTLSGRAVIDLTVGMDPEHPYAVVPFVLGKSPEKARRDVKAGSFNVGAEHFDNVTDRSKAVVIRQSPAYTGVSQHRLGSSVELWYSDDSQLDVDKMVNEFEVDPSQIISTELLNGAQTADDGGFSIEDDDIQW